MVGYRSKCRPFCCSLIGLELVEAYPGQYSYIWGVAVASNAANELCAQIEEELPENNVRAAIAGNLRALSVDLRRDWLDTIRRPYDNPESKGLGYDWRAVRRRQSDLESGRPNEPRSFHIPPAMKSKFQ